ncbi:hypothetical protein A3I18_01655 [Candidatus Campbellbacteria bacterium RIFCSPLOWO2_02_FULL_35_11]|uniref:Uncharacterized protein n=2 Tax=Candidatus Campbelliibacteriota TaxID=1752727 RepID=A0A1F5ELV1_9BACT|nr:MAG: hypothetical protein A3E89_01680 [Candidatus Campbellbacteria bacterium RIFCSPHIGHO2_12_FULL_35_10]OGD69803.1 MAG: hypothetical protein A3I18_01655 [Candidatus Campbellbacteria bacterium RIFCSPLOWO2_02_FULL_35_11]
MENFFLWWSVVSTLIGVILLCFSIWQYKDGKNQSDKIRAQVKVWMQEANGLSEALRRIVSDNLEKRYSTTDDVCNAVWALQISAFSLYQSLYEERCVTEEEYKARQKKIADMIDAEQTKQVK